MRSRPSLVNRSAVTRIVTLAGFVVAVAVGAAGAQKAGDAALGTQPYDRYERPEACATCHLDINRQHEQAMMSQAFVHHWDEIEYFELAVPHAEKEPKVAGVKAGCNGCHAPLAFLAGEIPPQRPSAGTRANEAVSCDICHTAIGFEGGDARRGWKIASTPFGTTASLSGGMRSSASRSLAAASETAITVCATRAAWASMSFA